MPRKIIDIKKINLVTSEIIAVVYFIFLNYRLFRQANFSAVNLITLRKPN